MDQILQGSTDLYNIEFMNIVAIYDSICNEYPCISGSILTFMSLNLKIIVIACIM